MCKKIVAIICLSLLFAPGVFSQSSGVHEHDGFFLRLLGGPSYSNQTYNDAPSDMKVYGVSGSFALQVGGTIAENLVAFGEVSGFTITNPSIDIGSTTYETEDTKSSSYGFGGGVTYYIMPANFYFTASILAANVSIEYTRGSTTYKGETDIGFGFFVGAGKEWWISDDWALGATGFFGFSNVPDKGSSDITITSTTFGVAFSATFQ